MCKTEDTVHVIVRAAALEFNSHNYYRGGVFLKIRPENIFATSGLYAEITPYSLYRRSCMHLSDMYAETRELVPSIFGVPDNVFQEEIKRLQSTIINNSEKIRPILMAISIRAHLKNETPTQEVEAQEPEDFIQEEQQAEARPYYRIDSKEIAQAMASVFHEMEINQGCNITAADIIGPCRDRPLVLCRQFSMYTANSCFPERHASSTAIGRNFGGRDHTTTLHSISKIAQMVTDNPVLATAIFEKVCEKLHLGPSQKEALFSGQKLPFYSWQELLEHDNATLSQRSGDGYSLKGLQ